MTTEEPVTPTDWMLDVSLVEEAVGSDDLPLREEHWSFFQADVLPFLAKLLGERFPAAIAVTLRQRLAIPNRFRASEIYYAMSRDCGEAGANIHGCATVELLLLARLIHDDVVDQHDYRWSLPTVRVTHGDAIATLIADELRSLAMLCAHRVPLQARNQSAVELIAQFELRMSSAMLRETTFRHGALQMQDFVDIASGKHCNGSLCGHLIGHQYGIGDAERRLLVDAIVHTDVAAAIANDLSEAHQRRGLDAVRIPTGEHRGKQTEFQLGRPTIFHTFLASDDRVRGQAENLLMDGTFDLRHVKPDEMYSVLHEMGAIDYAENLSGKHKQHAFSRLGESWPELREWIGSTARPNLPPSNGGAAAGA